MELDQAISIAKKWKLSLSQVVFMDFLDKGEPYPLTISDLEKSDLHARKLIKNGKPDEAWDRMRGDDKAIRPIKFGYTEEVLMVLNRAGRVLRQVDIDASTQKRILEEFRNNDQLASLFCIWLCMFPTTGPKNTGWDRLFGVTYTGVTLRIFTPKLSNFFKKIARKKDVDMSLFVLGTYLFIRSNINKGKAYIPKIQRFTDSWEEWYSIAEEAASGKTEEEVERIFDLPAPVNHNRSEYEIKQETVEQVGFIMQ